MFELAARIKQDANRPINVLFSGYGAMAVLGCVVHCIAAMLLSFQPLPPLGSLPACLHLPLRSRP